MTVRPAETIALGTARPALGRLAGSALPWFALLTVGCLGVLTGLLVAPGRSFIGIYVNDLMVFYDGAHRILEGQVPDRDFHTPLGPLAYLLSAFGLWAGGSLGRMMPMATAAFAALIAPPLFYVSVTRLQMRLAIPFVAYFAVLSIAPFNPGDPWITSTFAMFYNRFCWVALSILFTLALPPIRKLGRWPAVLDAACGAWLLLMMLYLKLSYAVVGLAFLAALLVLPSRRRMAILTLIASALGVAAVESLWGETRSYLADAIAAARVSGAVRGGAYLVAEMIVRNLRQESLYAAALALGILRRTRPVYLIASVVMALTGPLLLNQNSQLTEMPVLLPAALLALLGPSSEAPAAAPDHRLINGILIIAMVLPGIGAGLFALRHFRHEAKHPSGPHAAVAELDGVITTEGVAQPPSDRPATGVASDAFDQAFRSGLMPIATVSLLRQFASSQTLAQSEYLATVQDGAELLRAHPALQGPVFTYDMQNPFNAVLGRPPPRGDSSWNHYGRTFDEHIHLPAAAALKDVQVIMDPKDPMELYSEKYLKAIYAPYVDRNFRLAAESTYWRAYQRTSAEAAEPPTALRTEP